MANPLLEKIGGYVLDKALDDENVQETIKGFGKDLGEQIPGDFAEPNIKKTLDLMEEGMMSTVKKNNNN